MKALAEGIAPHSKSMVTVIVIVMVIVIIY